MMLKLLAFVACGLSAIAAGAVESAPISVRDSGNGRTWQVNLAPSEPIRWAWGSADSATLAVTREGETTPVAYDVARGENESFGACAIALPEDVDSAEHLLTLVLTLKSEGETVETRSAKVAYLPASFSVRKMGTREWKRVDGPRVFAYDRAWADPAADAVKLRLAAASALSNERTLAASGYDVIDATAVFGGEFGGEFQASLVFDEGAEFMANLKFGSSGLILLVK